MKKFLIICVILFAASCDDVPSPQQVSIALNSLASAYNGTPNQQISAPSNASSVSSPPRKIGISANHCVRKDYPGTNPNAFFKGHITNTCGRTISVKYCERAQCPTAYNFYNSLEFLSPGERAAVDVEGRGIITAACFYESPDYFTPRTNGPNGQYTCD